MINPSPQITKLFVRLVFSLIFLSLGWEHAFKSDYKIVLLFVATNPFPFHSFLVIFIMDEVLKEWKKLSLTNEDGERVRLTKSHFSTDEKHILAARFMTRSALNVEAVVRTFKPLWRARKEFVIREAGDHMLLFVFRSDTDAERVLANEPWSFDKHVVLFRRYNFSIQTKNLKFFTMKFWIKMHGLPMSMLNTITAMELEGTIGNYDAVNITNKLHDPRTLVTISAQKREKT